MKKLLGIMAIALLAVTWTCQAIDYNVHFYNQRVYRVALGSGTAPAASDMALIGLHNGDMVLNTDDDCLYIMHATNVYTKLTAAGAVTVTSMSPSTLTVSGDFTVNDGQVDINLIHTNTVINITQTNTGGKADTPFITINDPRTGANANSTNEASLFLNPAGCHAIVVTKGTSVFQAVETTRIKGDGAAITNVPITVTVTKQNITMPYAATNDPVVTISKQNVTVNYAATNDPAVTVTKQNIDMAYAATNDPVVTVAKQNIDIAYAATNDPTVTVTFNTTSVDPVTDVTANGLGRTVVSAVTPTYATITNYHTPVMQYVDMFGTNVVTNVTFTTEVIVVGTNTAVTSLSYDCVSNITVTKAGSINIGTNGTATATLTALSASVTTGATATATLTALSANVTTGATATATLTALSYSSTTGATATATVTPLSASVTTGATATATNP